MLYRFLTYVNSTSSQTTYANIAYYISNNFSKIIHMNLEELADELSRYSFVLFTEMGSGIVPIDPHERLWREQAGRLSCLLAQRAERVVRIFCGLPTVLKGEN